MADLKTANEVAEATEPFLDEWIKTHEGECMIAWKRNGKVKAQFFPSFKKAMKFQDSLPAEERAGSIFRDFSPNIKMF